MTGGLVSIAKVRPPGQERKKGLEQFKILPVVYQVEYIPSTQYLFFQRFQAYCMIVDYNDILVPYYIKKLGGNNGSDDGDDAAGDGMGGGSAMAA